MKKSIILLSAFLSIIFTINAQDHVFRIMATKGANKIQKGTSWSAISTGTKMYKGNKIQIASSGYVGLIHKTGRTLELKTAGVYDIISLESKLGSSSNSFAEKYAKFAFNDMDVSTKKHSVTGSVTRGQEMAYFVNKKQIELMPNTPLFVTWVYNVDSPDILDNFRLEVYSMEDGVLQKIPLDKDAMSVSFTLKEGIEPEDIALKLVHDDLKNEELDIEISGRPSPVLSWAKSLDPVSFEKEYKALKNELKDDTPMNDLMYASFFDEQGLTSYAIGHLARATESAPDIESFRDTYLNYLEETLEDLKNRNKDLGRLENAIEHYLKK